MGEWLQSNEATPDLIRTTVLVVILLIARWVVLLRLRRNDGLSNDLRRRWTAQVRTATVLLLLLGLTIIWGTELRTFALSIVAIAAAIVIATKELIMCVSGSVLKASGRSFSIGDRVEISGVRGDVIDITLLTTTLLEVGPGSSIHQHSGRTVVFPNSVLLTTPVVNETHFDEYVLHAFGVPVVEGEDWRLAEHRLLEIARAECGSYLDDAQERIEKQTKREGLETPSLDPRATLRFEDGGKLSLLVRIPVPARRKGRVEQAILRRFLDWRQAESAKRAAQASADKERATPGAAGVPAPAPEEGPGG